MKKVLFIAVALFVCTSFSFASDLESTSFDAYSLDPLVNSALDYAVMPLADASWSTSDSLNLSNIEDTLTRSTSLSGGSVLYNLITIRENVVDQSDILQAIDDNFTLNVSANDGSLIDSVRDAAYLKTIFIGGSGTYANPQSGSALSYLAYLPNLVSLQTMDYNLDYIENDTSAISSNLRDFYNFYSNNQWRIPLFGLDSEGNVTLVHEVYDTLPAFLGQMIFGLSSGAINPYTHDRSLYSLVQQLQKVLASDDDLALAESQKQNREEIEDSFLNGSSGSTSLGASDFGDLSDVGGTVNDTLSLNGQASVSSFTSGLSGADQEGQNWFSAATRDSLDSVSSGISTFALDDPYNMEGWEDHYSWVLGGE